MNLLLFYLSLVTFAFAQGFGSSPGSKNSGQAADEAINLNPLTIQSIEIPEYKIGERTPLTVFFELAEGHHAYIEQFQIEIESPNYVYISEPEISPIVDFKDPVSKKTKKGTTGNSQLKAIIQISKEDYEKNSSLKNKTELPLNLFLTYQACTKTYCLFPKKIPLQGVLKISGTPGTSQPEPFDFSFESALSKSLFLAFLVVFFAGVLTSFTPCIFPMIPITLAVLGAHQLGDTKAQHSRRHGFILSIIYVLGIAFTYSVLGVIAAQTGALFGSLLGHPVAVTIIAALFVAMGLSMFGLFDVKISDKIATKISNKFSKNVSGQKNFVGVFLSGLIAGVVASPCVGPVLVSILTFVAQTQNTVLGFFLLFTFALGLGQIFIVMGTFSQLLKKLPRSGPWLNGIKYVFGTVMILMAAYYVYPILPKLNVKEKIVGEASEKESDDYLKPKWLTYSEENLAKARAAGIPVIIDIKADWCVACKELEVKTFSHKEVYDLGKRFVWLEFDATNNSPELEVLKEKYKILGLPFVTFHGPDGQWLSDLTVTGFEPAAPFLGRMQKALTANK